MFLHPRRLLQPLKMKGSAGSSSGEVSTSCPLDFTVSHPPGYRVGPWHLAAKEAKVLVLISDETACCMYVYPCVTCTIPCAQFTFQGVSSNDLFMKSQLTEPLQEQINLDFLDRRVSHEKFSPNFVSRADIRHTAHLLNIAWPGLTSAQCTIITLINPNMEKARKNEDGPMSKWNVDEPHDSSRGRAGYGF